MTTRVAIERSNVALGTFQGPNGRPVDVFITKEHRRPLEQLAALVNAQQALIENLIARVEALES